VPVPSGRKIMADAEDTTQGETPSERKARLIEEIKERAYELVSPGDEVEAHSMGAGPDVFEESVDAVTVCALVYVSDN
jgi:hypothetical protein